MFKDTDTINIYNDYDYKIYMGSANPIERDYILIPKVDGEPSYIPVLWRDIVRVNRISSLIKEKAIRFDSDIEEEVWKQLRIDFNREKESYSRQEIENMIINPTDDTIHKILSISKISVIEAFLSQLVALKNSNKYFIAEKVELYIRARKEEILEGIKKSELEVTPTENETILVEDVELGVIEEDKNNQEQSEKIEKEEIKAPKANTGKKPANSKKKTN